MTPSQLTLIRDSFALVVPIKDVAARLFYDRLFELDPNLRRLFDGTDLAAQGQKLMAALSLVVAGLERQETLLPKIEALALRHLSYGVEVRHYAVVGEALIDTLVKGLGVAFTADVRSAWEAAYAMLSSVMIVAAYPEALRA